jgi:hypothetical protein
VLVTSFYFLLAGVAIGWVIGYAHRLDRDEARREVDLPSAWLHRRYVENKVTAIRVNHRRPT